jgi:hypothetical protein
MFITQQGYAYVERYKNQRLDMTKADIPNILADIIQGSASIVWQYQTYGLYQGELLKDGIVENLSAWLFDLFRVCYDDAIPETIMVPGAGLQKYTEYLMDIFQAVPKLREAWMSYPSRNLNIIQEGQLHVDPYSGEIVQLSNEELGFEGAPLLMELKGRELFYQDKPFQEHNLHQLAYRTLEETVDRL